MDIACKLPFRSKYQTNSSFSPSTHYKILTKRAFMNFSFYQTLMSGIKLAVLQNICKCMGTLQISKNKGLVWGLVAYDAIHQSLIGRQIKASLSNILLLSLCENKLFVGYFI